MTGRFNKSRFGGSNDGGEDINPMDSVSNLADVMLVLAVGFMLALVINWNIDVTPKNANTSEEQRGEEISEIEGFTSGGETPLDGEVEYEELGVVYRDPITGKMYMVQKNEDETGN